LGLFAGCFIYFILIVAEGVINERTVALSTGVNSGVFCRCQKGTSKVARYELG